MRYISIGEIIKIEEREYIIIKTKVKNTFGEYERVNIKLLCEFIKNDGRKTKISYLKKKGLIKLSNIKKEVNN